MVAIGDKVYTTVTSTKPEIIQGIITSFETHNGMGIIILIIVMFIFGICTGKSCNEDTRTRCGSDGYYTVKINDKETEKQIWAKTNRKCTLSKSSSIKEKKTQSQPASTTNENQTSDQIFKLDSLAT